MTLPVPSPLQTLPARDNKTGQNCDLRSPREATRRTSGKSLAQIVEELARYFTGWRAYFGFGQTRSVLRELNQWTRRLLQAVTWKRWKNGRTRFAELTSGASDGTLRRQPPEARMVPGGSATVPVWAIALPNAAFGLARLAIPRTPQADQSTEPACSDPYAPVVWEGEGRRNCDLRSPKGRPVLPQCNISRFNALFSRK